jgi:Family of unknown function (DUF6440)
MKKTLLVIGSALFLFGCSSTQVSSDQGDRFKYIHEESELNIIQDKQTGCKYLQYDGYKQGGITILLDKNGKPDCSK